jgi:hypothetical protein
MKNRAEEATSKGLEALAVDDRRARFIILPLGYPHLRNEKRKQGVRSVF